MVVADGARWTVRHDDDGWNLWRHRLGDGDRAEKIESFGADAAAARAVANAHGGPVRYEAFLSQKRLS